MSVLNQHGFNYDIPFDNAVVQIIGVAQAYWQTATEDSMKAGGYAQPEVLFEKGARVIGGLST
jgi:hypothetical protein